MPPQCSRTDDTTESSEHSTAARAIRAAEPVRDLPGLTPHAFPTEPRHFRPHRIPKHARSTVLGRETEVCFEVTAQGWRRLSSIVDATTGPGAHRMRVHEANEEVAYGAVACDEQKWLHIKFP